MLNVVIVTFMVTSVFWRMVYIYGPLSSEKERERDLQKRVTVQAEELRLLRAALAIDEVVKQEQKT